MVAHQLLSLKFLVIFRPILAVYATKWQIAHDLRSEMFPFREAKSRLCHVTSSTSLPEGWMAAGRKPGGM